MGKRNSNEQKTKEYLDTLTKPRIIETCLQYMYDNQLLEKQLEQAQTRISELEDKDWYEACIKQLEEQNNRLIDTLKEKDKEIERLNTIKNNAIECAYLFKVALSVRQKDLAIQELEKVKEKIDCEMAIRECDISEQTADVCVSIADQIDDQIKELKG